MRHGRPDSRIQRCSSAIWLRTAGMEYALGTGMGWDGNIPLLATYLPTYVKCLVRKILDFFFSLLFLSELIVRDLGRLESK